MAKLVPYVIVLILAVFAPITLSDGSSYYSWNYGGVSSNGVEASPGGYESPASEENQYDAPPSSEGDVDSTNAYYGSQYAHTPNAGADDSSTVGDVTYASPPDMSSAPSSVGTMPNNSDKTYKDQLSPSSSYDDSSTPPQSESSSSSSYDDSSTPPSDSSSSSSYDDSSTPQSDSSSSSSYDDSSSSSSSDDSSSSSSSSSTREEDSSPTTTDESQSGTEEKYNSVEEVGSRVDGTEMKTEHSGSKAVLVFGLLIGVCAVVSAGFIYIKKKRESYPNTNSYISLTKWDRI